MLHLQKRLLLSRHQWLLTLTRFAASTASSSASPGHAPFAVADYLAASCHLTRNQALRASRKLSHFKSPSKPDAVLAALSGFGFTPQDIAAAVIRHPELLCCKVDKTLALRFAALKDHGLSASQIARLLVLDPRGFLQPAIVSKLKYYVHLFGSVDDLVKAIPHSRNLLSADLENVVKPNVRRLEDQVRLAVSRDPGVLTVSKDKALRVSKFLMSVVRLDPEYIAYTPAMLKFCLQGRHIPRHYVMKFLKANGLLKHDRSYYSAVVVTEKVFMERFICPFKEAAPHLAEDYAAARRGEVPSRFIL
ncbi:hypothetical protein SETIT_4G095800v2 [Setaria italica]|uniref:Uncharacterized protein n=1 Tax=Setaria italica TaxID=4555 RepID=A0A368QSH6_SETIT|nr:hypothetical protein SETIT_4G095800v2 [Setaria italica]